MSPEVSKNWVSHSFDSGDWWAESVVIMCSKRFMTLRTRDGRRESGGGESESCCVSLSSSFGVAGGVLEGVVAVSESGSGGCPSFVKPKYSQSGL